MDRNPDIAAIIVAAGTGSRVAAGSGCEVPKQFRHVRGAPMLRHSYAALCAHPAIARIIVVVGEDQELLARAALDGLPAPQYVNGGAARRDSVRNALEALSDNPPALVLIHDAARPFLPAKVIDDLIGALSTHGGAVPALPIVDSLARGGAASRPSIMGPAADREGLWRIQTPQAFHFDAILAAHRAWDAGHDATDDARMAAGAGHSVALVAGCEALSKFTFSGDFENDGPLEQAPAIDSNAARKPAVRSGTGYDVHRLVSGETLWLCGIEIEHHSGLLGHSDADVALHALTDAIFGAMALGDIGDHFPPSDPQWRGASSDQFLTYAVELAIKHGYSLANIDLTLICEAPKIGPHRMAMRDRLARLLGIAVDQVSVKATTTERLGFTGREEGIAAQAIATFCLAQASKDTI